MSFRTSELGLPLKTRDWTPSHLFSGNSLWTIQPRLIQIYENVKWLVISLVIVPIWFTWSLFTRPLVRSWHLRLLKDTMASMSKGNTLIPTLATLWCQSSPGQPPLQVGQTQRWNQNKSPTLTQTLALTETLTLEPAEDRLSKERSSGMAVASKV